MEGFGILATVMLLAILAIVGPVIHLRRHRQCVEQCPPSVMMEPTPMEHEDHSPEEPVELAAPPPAPINNAGDNQATISPQIYAPGYCGGPIPNAPWSVGRRRGLSSSP